MIHAPTVATTRRALARARSRYLENIERIPTPLLSMALGYATGAASGSGDTERFWKWIQFANRLNATNPNFVPYEIPEEHR